LKDISVTASPIPLEMPSHLRKSSDFIEGIGEPTTASFLTESEADPIGWCVIFIV
jgi:hypothetical protein